MEKDHNIQDDFKQYLSGKLNLEARNEFEKRLQEDPNLRHALGAEVNVEEGIQGYAFKNMLKKIHQKLYGNES